MTVARYIAAAPAKARPALRAMRAAIRSVVPKGAKETISYRIPAFERDGIIVWYAAFRDHVSLFPKASVLARFKKELAGYKTSRGTVQFPLDRRLPTGLIKRIVRARVAEHGRRRMR